MYECTGTVGKLNVFGGLRAACGCLHWRSARLILKPFKYSDTVFELLLIVLFVLYVSSCLDSVVVEYRIKSLLYKN